jgi:DNA invertase Pin-like site-specific DNA recombinase
MLFHAFSELPFAELLFMVVPCNIVCVAAFDRMARSTKHFLQVMDEFDDLGIEFVSRRENVDTTGAMGRLFLTLIGSIAELESDLIRERIKAGMRRRKLEGYKLGRQPLDINHAALVRDRVSGMSLSPARHRRH